jgi:transposase-like protein
MSRVITDAHGQPGSDDEARLLQLNDKQTIAVQALVAGSSQCEAAQVAGVTRETVNRWVRQHPAVRARLNEHRAALASEHEDAVRRLRGKALAVVENQLDRGDVRAALHVLRLVGVETPCDDVRDARAILDGAIDAEAERAQFRAVREALGPHPCDRQAVSVAVVRRLADEVSEVEGDRPGEVG